MTDLQIRRIPFDLDGDIPFAWQPENPEFGMMMNHVSVLAIGFEKYIVQVMRDAQERITDPAVMAEADAFLRQEAGHAKAHRMHWKALMRTHPGLQTALDGIVASYDELYAAEPLEFHLAYIADLEATFTPTFKLMLDHDDELFAPGDDRVASLLVWHFVEEVEHRSSGLVVFDHVVGDSWYRLRQIPAVLRHLTKAMNDISAAINEAVPFEDRLVDARCLGATYLARKRLARFVPALGENVALGTRDALDCASIGERIRTFGRVVASQTPGHDPEHQPLPALADSWFAAYDGGADVTHWYGRTAAA